MDIYEERQENMSLAADCTLFWLIMPGAAWSSKDHFSCFLGYPFPCKSVDGVVLSGLSL